jgi:hypothetical protein
MGGSLTYLDGTTEDRPPGIMTGMPDKQHPAGFVDREHRNRRQVQQIMPHYCPRRAMCSDIPTRATVCHRRDKIAKSD